VLVEADQLAHDLLASLDAQPLLNEAGLDLQTAKLGGVAHEVGTLRLAGDNGGVVDENLKFLANENLYACDNSVFPASPAANPSLTTAALSLRQARHLNSSLTAEHPAASWSRCGQGCPSNPTAGTRSPTVPVAAPVVAAYPLGLRLVRGRVMSDVSAKREAAPLSRGERVTAGLVGVGLLGAAVALVVAPPQHRVALGQCPRARVGCIVSVDGDLTTFAAVLAAFGAAAFLIALLGIRFNRVKVAGTEFGYERATAGLPHAAPAADAEVNAAAPPEKGPTADDSPKEVPVQVTVQDGLGERLHLVPVPITQLTSPMRDVDATFLRDYQSARKVSQHSVFLTHILGPATQAGQKYSVAIRVTPHREATLPVKSAAFYLGKSWGNRVFEGRPGLDGRLGIATEAYGAFLALCEVEFADGSRILLDHYCDFDMGSLLAK
jgi:hypothetical protein